jgi:eukaryotic-like serine/threonine-protein kinase
MSLREQLQRSLGTAYTLERELGGGGMSRVFVAEEMALGRQVVVKVLPPEIAAGVNVDRFKREIQLAARLQHPHIVPLLSAGEMAGLPYYTMPFVEGESLRARLARSGAMSITEVIGVLRDVAKALGYAHEHGVVHRDIKPDNVLLSGGSATVADFGIAKAIAAARTDGGDHPATLTQIGSSLGTPAYMAPEQAAADPSTNHRADIYAFGCMAYELLSGRPPFIAKTPQRLLAAQMSDAPEPIKALRLDTPDSLAELVMRCLEKDADARPQSASAIVQVLENVTSGSGYHAMPPVLIGGAGMVKKALLAYAAAFVFVAVLAKAAIVAIGLPDWVFPGALVVMALGLPVILFTAYVHHATRTAVTQTPTYTPGGTPSANQGTMATLAIKASPHVSWRRTWMGGVFAVGAFVALIAGYMVLRALGIGPFASLLSAGTIQRNEKLLVADFNSSASDSAIGPVVTEAFRTALGQSQTISILQPTDVREVLRRMQKPANTKVDFTVAREVATREGIKAVVVGDIIALGGNYAIAVRLVSPQSGEELARFRETAEGDRALLPAIDKLAKDLRAKIGESLKSVQSALPLERVTTPSLEALKKYVQGNRVMSFEGDFTKGSELLGQAIALDSGFAMAYRRLAVEYNNRLQFDRAMDLLQKGYEHSNRLSDAERYLLLGTYYQMGPKQDLAKSIASYESAIDVQPDFVTAINNNANNYRWQRNWPKAEEAYQRAIASRYAPAVAYSNLAWTQFAMAKRAEAWRTLAAFDSALPANAGTRNVRSTLLFQEGKYDSAAAVRIALMRQRPNDLPVHAAGAAFLATLARTRGRLREAARWDAELASVNAQRGIAQAALSRDADGEVARSWFLGDRSSLVALERTLAQTSIERMHPSARPYLQVASAYSLAGRPDKARQVVALFERGRATVVQTSDAVVRHSMLGDIALAERRYDDAIREWRAADEGTCVVCALPRLAQAYDLAGQSDSAVAVYERYLSTPQLTSMGIDQWYLASTQKRLGELYEAKGDRQNALSHYLKFVELWKDADPELQPRVAEVRARVARLKDQERR